MSTQDAGSEDRGACTPCRGTGRLVSNLGGEPHEVTCPWCEGSGRFKAEHDAQEHVGEGARSGQPPAPETPE